MPCDVGTLNLGCSSSPAPALQSPPTLEHVSSRKSTEDTVAIYGIQKLTDNGHVTSNRLFKIFLQFFHLLNDFFQDLQFQITKGFLFSYFIKF